MDISIQQVSNGAPFSAKFGRVVVQKCHYESAANERVENMNFMGGVETTFSRFTMNGPIDVNLFDKDFSLRLPSFMFQLPPRVFYSNDEIESMQASFGIRMVKPVRLAEFENGIVSLFFLSIQKGEVIASLILNPPGVDDYYYRMIFYES